MDPLEIPPSTPCTKPDPESDINRARIVAASVRKACNVATNSMDQDKQDWKAARQIILQDKVLTENEKDSIHHLSDDTIKSEKNSEPSNFNGINNSEGPADCR
ncbi:12899_t:CDS:2 [Acaulospora morrowiae]|uniref:12899_t:CDS:1 n=1 Tax=Acaulospora morrowiae TaxID=94023 RepID=A0A9N9CBV0_9GLOM|nr:12899_t:CDS:2 [Acaulospora morrowiae]